MTVLLDARRLGAGMGELLDLSDIVIGNERFAAEFSHSSDMKRSLVELTQMGPRIAVITLGEEGAIALEGETLVRQPALPIEVYDTTGASEVFRGAFIYGQLQGWPLERCLPFANAAAGAQLPPPRRHRRHPVAGRGHAGRRHVGLAPAQSSTRTGGELTGGRIFFAPAAAAARRFRGFRLARPLNCRANMKARCWLAAAVVLPATLAAAPRAHAADDAAGFGSRWTATSRPPGTNSVTDMTTTASKDRSRGLAGFATLGNFGPNCARRRRRRLPGHLRQRPVDGGGPRLAAGGRDASIPGAGGAGRRALQRRGRQFLRLAGDARDVADYLGARLGTSDIGGGRPFELGAWLFLRKDGQATVTNSRGAATLT